MITRDSPEEYQQLVGELGSLQQMLESIRDAICSRNTVYLITGERRLAFHRTMCRFLSAFETLDAIVSSFRALATDSGMDVWRRSLWGARQSGIHNIRARLMAHASTLILVLMDQLETLVHCRDPLPVKERQLMQL